MPLALPTFVQVPPIMPIDLTALRAVFMGISVVLIPVLGKNSRRDATPGGLVALHRNAHNCVHLSALELSDTTGSFLDSWVTGSPPWHLFRQPISL